MGVRAKAAFWSRCVLITIVCVMLAGCGGVAALLAPYLVIKQWQDWFGDDNEKPTDYQVFLDGYEVGTLGDASGVLNLKGVTARDYLVTVSRPPNYTRGLQAQVFIDTGGSVDLRQQNLFEGGAISGTIRRDTTSGTPLAAARVIAIREGAITLADGTAPLQIPPAANSGMDVMIGYTDDAGTYRIGPALYGDWLVFSTLAGYGADAEYVSVSATHSGTANLVLQQDPGVATGVVGGSVSRSGGLLDSALVTAFLQTPYLPDIPADARNAVANASGRVMPAGPWFSFTTLTTIAPGTRDYSITLPAGAHDLEAYKFNYVAQTTTVDVTQGSAVVQDFTLSHR